MQHLYNELAFIFPFPTLNWVEPDQQCRTALKKEDAGQKELKEELRLYKKTFAHSLRGRWGCKTNSSERFLQQSSKSVPREWRLLWAIQNPEMEKKCKTTRRGKSDLYEEKTPDVQQQNETELMAQYGSKLKISLYKMIPEAK